MTTGVSGSRLAMVWVIFIVRPKEVRTTVGALLLGDLRDVERDRAVHEDTGDEELLAFEDSHGCDFLEWVGRLAAQGD